MLASDEMALVVGTNSGLGVINTLTLKAEAHIDLGEDIPRAGNYDGSDGGDGGEEGGGMASVPIGGGYTFGVAVADEGVGTSSLYCTVASAFSPDVTVVSVILDSDFNSSRGSRTPTSIDALLATADGDGSGGGGGSAGAAVADDVLTMVATTPLVEGSPLHATMNLVSKDDPKTPGKGKGVGLKSKSATGTKKKSGGGVDSPLTFGNKIRSSGYGSPASAPRKMFQPNTARPDASKKPPPGSSSLSKRGKGPAPPGEHTYTGAPSCMNPCARTLAECTFLYRKM